MPDREKVANGLKHCMHYCSCFDCPYDGPNCQNDVLDDALALLKEQPEIVRCRDCKYSGHCDTEDFHRCTDPDGWFCADGERKKSWER